jgi:hypothetical protein
MKNNLATTKATKAAISTPEIVDKIIFDLFIAFEERHSTFIRLLERVHTEYKGAHLVFTCGQLYSAASCVAENIEGE